MGQVQPAEVLAEVRLGTCVAVTDRIGIPTASCGRARSTRELAPLVRRGGRSRPAPRMPDWSRGEGRERCESKVQAMGRCSLGVAGAHVAWRRCVIGLARSRSSGSPTSPGYQCAVASSTVVELFEQLGRVTRVSF